MQAERSILKSGEELKAGRIAAGTTRAKLPKNERSSGGEKYTNNNLTSSQSPEPEGNTARAKNPQNLLVIVRPFKVCAAFLRTLLKL